jgi:hypothetical protein
VGLAGVGTKLMAVATCVISCVLQRSFESIRAEIHVLFKVTKNVEIATEPDYRNQIVCVQSFDAEGIVEWDKASDIGLHEAKNVEHPISLIRAFAVRSDK